MSDEIAELLAEGLDLCVRAKRLDRQMLGADMAKLGYYGPETKCGTPHLWAQDQYDKDLADWQSRARKALTKLELVK